MNILEILNSLGTQNIEGLINLLSTLFGNSNNKPQVTLPPNKIESPPETNFDANSSYWSLPTYNFPQTQNTQSTNDSQHQNLNNTFPQSKNFTNNQPKTNNQLFANSGTMQSTMQYENNVHSTQNLSKNTNFLEILKVLLPLFKKSTPAPPQVEVAKNQESEILKLNKVK